MGSQGWLCPMSVRSDTSSVKIVGNEWMTCTTEVIVTNLSRSVMVVPMANQEYIRVHRRDLAYRSHIARQMAGYACDLTSGCPHHPENYQYFNPPMNNTKLYEYEASIQNAMVKFRRANPRSITALELLSSHYLRQVHYCDRCYDMAVLHLEKNEQLLPCDECFSKRNSYIKRFHGHQSSFLEPWDRCKVLPFRKGHLLICQMLELTVDYDRYLWYSDLYLAGGGGLNPITNPAHRDRRGSAYRRFSGGHLQPTTMAAGAETSMPIGNSKL